MWRNIMLVIRKQEKSLKLFIFISLLCFHTNIHLIRLQHNRTSVLGCWIIKTEKRRKRKKKSLNKVWWVALENEMDRNKNPEKQKELNQLFMLLCISTPLKFMNLTLNLLSDCLCMFDLDLFLLPFDISKSI